MALISFVGSPHGGKQRLLPEWRSQPPITPRTIIDHSIVGSADGAWLMFRDRSSLESHFIVCSDGEIWQLMDTGRQADANLNANAYALSIETEDRGNPDIQPWTGEQCDSLIWLHRKLLAVHSTIPNRKSRSCSDPGGHGYHTLHGAPSCWTPVSKSCPGAIRKKQWNEKLLPAYLKTTPLGEDDLTNEEHEWLEWLRKNAVVLRDEGVRMTAQGDPSLAAGREVNNLANVLAQIDELRKIVLALVPPGT